MAKILIIEDEEAILMALEDNLKLEGYVIESARDGEKGLSMARSGKYDLIILDIMLPRMDGFEVCKQLRQDRIFTPILMLTAKSQEIDKVLGLELGADDYVTKPFSPRELLARVKALLRRSKQVQQGREPELSDFARVFDYSVLQGRYDTQSAKEAIVWLRKQATRGGWSGYDEMLAEAQESLEKGEDYICNIYIGMNAEYPQEYRYRRRLPSFRGPNLEKRNLVLWGRDDGGVSDVTLGSPEEG